jgi:hypothetical protein
VGDQRHAPAAYLRERTGTHCEGGYVGSRPGLDMCRKIRLHRDSIHEPVAGGYRIMMGPAVNYTNYTFSKVNDFSSTKANFDYL